MDPERRWDLAHDALVPGGAVALFWNPQGVRDAEAHAALAEVDHRHGIADAPHGEMASSYGDVPGNWADRREQVLAETARVLEAHGGGIDMEHFSDLFLARVR